MPWEKDGSRKSMAYKKGPFKMKSPLKEMDLFGLKARRNRRWRKEDEEERRQQSLVGGGRR
jgi:hypothetical protein